MRLFIATLALVLGLSGGVEAAAGIEKNFNAKVDLHEFCTSIRVRTGVEISTWTALSAGMNKAVREMNMEILNNADGLERIMDKKIKKIEAQINVYRGLNCAAIDGK